MRTNIVLDDRLIEEAMRASQARTKREAVDIALRAYVETKNRTDLRTLAGTVEFYDGYDYKELRRIPHVSD
ncbi:MAG: type II toxin-antitoxin system VapB family antitoxin [Coriobacteriales bacterium]|jgi:Arc/MetJ family transcription regulator|nr:type II toxin-antitoxin system VapB family antitoxin [Coriobacteriales bacterium]